MSYNCSRQSLWGLYNPFISSVTAWSTRGILKYGVATPFNLAILSRGVCVLISKTYPSLLPRLSKFNRRLQLFVDFLVPRRLSLLLRRMHSHHHLPSKSAIQLMVISPQLPCGRFQHKGSSNSRKNYSFRAILHLLARLCWIMTIFRFSLSFRTCWYRIFFFH